MGKLLFLLKFNVQTDDLEYNLIRIINTSKYKWNSYEFNYPIILKNQVGDQIPLIIDKTILVEKRLKSDPFFFYCYYTINIPEGILLNPLEHPIYKRHHIYLEEPSDKGVKILFFEKGYQLILKHNLTSYLKIYNNLSHISPDGHIIAATMNDINLKDLVVTESLLIDQYLQYWIC